MTCSFIMTILIVKYDLLNLLSGLITDNYIPVEWPGCSICQASEHNSEIL
jgi:hypothetical protein